MDSNDKLMVDDAEAAALLSISPDDLEWLAVTGQLDPILIRGRRLFDTAQLQQLIVTYRTVQSRGTRSDENKHSQHAAPHAGSTTALV